MANQYLCCTLPVAVLQFDTVITGDVSLLPGINKNITVRKQSNGKTRVLIYGLNQELFVGKFLQCTGRVEAIENIVAGDAGANRVDAEVVMLSAPVSVTVTL